MSIAASRSPPGRREAIPTIPAVFDAPDAVPSTESRQIGRSFLFLARRGRERDAARVVAPAWRGLGQPAGPGGVVARRELERRVRVEALEPSRVGVRRDVRAAILDRPMSLVGAVGRLAQ